MESVIRISVAASGAELIAIHSAPEDGLNCWTLDNMSAGDLDGIGKMFLLAAKIAESDIKQSHGMCADLIYSIETDV